MLKSQSTLDPMGLENVLKRSIASMENELKLAENAEKQMLEELQDGISQIDQMTLDMSQHNVDCLKDLISQQLIEIEKAQLLAKVMTGLEKYRNILMEEISGCLKAKPLVEDKENRISVIKQPGETIDQTKKHPDPASIRDAAPCTPKTGDEFERSQRENQIDDFEWDISTELEIQNEIKDHTMPSTQEVLATEVKKSNISEENTNDWEMMKEFYNLQDDSSDDDIEIFETTEPNVGSTGALIRNSVTTTKRTETPATAEVLNKNIRKPTFVRKTRIHDTLIVDRTEQITGKRPRLNDFELNSAPSDTRVREKRESDKKINFTFKKKTASGLKNLPQFTP